MYFVDWSDPCYPDIKPARFANGYQDIMTWTQCKKEIDQDLSYQIRDLQMRRKYYRSIRKDDPQF